LKILSLDCDWAPNFVLEYVAKILTANKIRATWFITNDSPFLTELESNPLFELGIHPNFDITSTQGNSVDEILTNIKKILIHIQFLKLKKKLYLKMIPNKSLN